MKQEKQQPCVAGPFSDIMAPKSKQRKRPFAQQKQLYWIGLY